jgi:hypothetical protein
MLRACEYLELINSWKCLALCSDSLYQEKVLVPYEVPWFSTVVITLVSYSYGSMFWVECSEILSWLGFPGTFLHTLGEKVGDNTSINWTITICYRICSTLSLTLILLCSAICGCKMWHCYGSRASVHVVVKKIDLSLKFSSGCLIQCQQLHKLSNCR